MYSKLQGGNPCLESVQGRAGDYFVWDLVPEYYGRREVGSAVMYVRHNGIMYPSWWPLVVTEEGQPLNNWKCFEWENPVQCSPIWWESQCVGSRIVCLIERLQRTPPASLMVVCGHKCGKWCWLELFPCNADDFTLGWVEWTFPGLLPIPEGQDQVLL